MKVEYIDGNIRLTSTNSKEGLILSAVLFGDVAKSAQPTTPTVVEKPGRRAGSRYGKYKTYTVLRSSQIDRIEKEMDAIAVIVGAPYLEKKSHLYANKARELSREFNCSVSNIMRKYRARKSQKKNNTNGHLYLNTESPKSTGKEYGYLGLGLN